MINFLKKKSINPKEVINDLLETYRYSKEIGLESEKIEAKRKILIMKMEQEHELYKNIFYELFKERRMAINKSFEIIDRGILEGNRDYISLGLSSLSQVVTTSPFKDAKELSNMLERGDKIEF